MKTELYAGLIFFSLATVLTYFYITAERFDFLVFFVGGLAGIAVTYFNNYRLNKRPRD